MSDARDTVNAPPASLTSKTEPFHPQKSYRRHSDRTRRPQTRQRLRFRPHAVHSPDITPNADPARRIDQKLIGRGRGKWHEWDGGKYRIGPDKGPRM